MKKRINSNNQRARGGSGGARFIREPTATVLHIDDDPNDAELLEAAMRKAQAEFIVHNVADADQAMAYLNGQGPYSDRKRYRFPSLILLDLKMPRATGFEVLKWLRSKPAFTNVPVVVLSGSELHDDIQQAYAVGANSYLVKPLGFNELVALVREIDKKWLKSVPSLPPANGRFKQPEERI